VPDFLGHLQHSLGNGFTRKIPPPGVFFRLGEAFLQDLYPEAFEDVFGADRDLPQCGNPERGYGM
jgi:hypothetical protein